MVKVGSAEQILIEAFLEDRDNYIHYTTKLEELQTDKIKKENAGSKVSKNGLERLVRVGFGQQNEQKLSAATSSYAVSLKKFKIESENLMEKRLRIMNPVLVEVRLAHAALQDRVPVHPRDHSLLPKHRPHRPDAPRLQRHR